MYECGIFAGGRVSGLSNCFEQGQIDVPYRGAVRETSLYRMIIWRSKKCVKLTSMKQERK